MGFIKNLKLKGKVLVSMVLLVIVAFAVVIPMVASKAEQQAQVDAFKIAQEMGYRYANEVDADLESLMSALKGLSFAFSQYKTWPVEQRRKIINNILKKTLQETPQVNSIFNMWELNALDGLDAQYIGSPDATEKGRFVGTWRRGENGLSLGGDTEESLNSSEYYQLSKNTKKEALTNPFFYSFTGKKEDEMLLASITAPIIENNQFLGVVGFDLNLERFQEIVEDVKPYEEGYVFIVAPNGMRVTHPNKELLGKTVGNDVPEQQEWILNSMKKKEIFSFFKKSTVDDTESYFLFTPFQVGESADVVYLVVVIPMEKVHETGRAISAEILRSSAFFIVIILVIVILIIVLLTSSIAKPIIRYSGGLAAAASGVKTASGQISASSQQLASGSSELASSVEEMTASIEELQSIIEANSKVAHEGEILSKQNMEVTVAKAQNTMQKLHDALIDINENSQKIVSIIKVIDDISFQTNILALNAAVEAARAGDAGRGFAVVADQVKDLATKSAEAAKETAELIEKAVESVRIGQGYGEEVEKATSDSAEMSEKVRIILMEISKASEEQLKGANQVTQAITQINNVVQATASSSEELAAAGEELYAQSESSEEMVNSLNNLIQKERVSKKQESFVKPQTSSLNQNNNNGFKARQSGNSSSFNRPKNGVELIRPEDKIPLDDFDGF